jgi:hypothetical protein
VPAPAAADTSPTGATYRRITFPVAGAVSYRDDFGDCRAGCTRRHEGNDVMGSKMLPLLAAVDGEVTFVRDDASGTSGNMLILEDAKGWTYYYIHVNNDTPGTDDGANAREHAFAPGIEEGSVVRAGQHVAYMGDSGNAESTQAHLHFEIHRPDGTPINPYVSLRLAQGYPAGGLCAFPTNPPAHPDASANRGYWSVEPGGRVRAFGAAPHYGDLAGSRRAGDPPVVDLARTPSGAGYWLVDAAGRVHPFGDAPQLGGMEGTALNAPVIGMTATATGDGYWLLARDGGIFSFGDAEFYGSTGGMRLNAPVIAMASARYGRGYWLLASDGGIFSFGDAEFYGSTGGMRLNAPVVGMAKTSDSRGYWLLGRDGGVFSFGNARFTGSLPGTGECGLPAAVSMTRTTTGRGYLVLLADGRVMAFGDAVVHGSPTGTGAISLEMLPNR